jgi:hypothetical protein
MKRLYRQGDIDMPGILVGETWVECRLVLFDLDGTLVDKEFRYRSLAKARLSMSWTAPRIRTGPE